MQDVNDTAIMTNVYRYRRAQAGQSLIIAVSVLFILAFLASVFIIVIARNLERTQRYTDTLTADYYAQSGVRYADQMLLTSPQGADWRPPLDYQLGTVATAGVNYVGELQTDEQNQYSAISADLPAVPTNHPDAYWLYQGFSLYNAQGGRFLIRLSYASAPPVSASYSADTSPYDNTDYTTGKYIKIESIGRTGELNTFFGNNKLVDPTTFQPQPIRLHAEEVAYVPIALTDYARFITDKDNRSDTANLGVPSINESGAIVTPSAYDFASTGTTIAPTAITTTYGNPYTDGGSLRSNTDLRLYGNNAAYLNAENGDAWEIAGNLTFDGYNSATAATNPTALTVSGVDTSGTAQANATVYPSNVTTYGGNFTTVGGLIRDAGTSIGGTSTDMNGFPRQITRLNPPSLDTQDPASRLGRYAALAIIGTSSAATSTDDGPYKPEPTIQTSTATSGGSLIPQTPATVYIDNLADQQQESTNIVSGAYTLRDDWVNRTSSYWQGPFYNPPGATIVFGPVTYYQSGVAIPAWGFTVTRSDLPVGDPAGSPTTWHWDSALNTQDTTHSIKAPTVTFVYGAEPGTGFIQDPSRPVYFLDADNAPGASATSVNNDIVIYAEGNVRVRGVISDPSTTALSTTLTEHHVTLVTGGTAYVEGSILKGGAGYTTSYNARSSIAILAEHYVCVNTTQFMAGALANEDIDERTTDPNTNSLVFADNTLTEAFDLPPVNYVSSLYVSQYSDNFGPSYGHIDFEQTDYTGAAAPTVNPLVSYDSNNLIGASNTPNRDRVSVNGGFGFANAGYTNVQFAISRSTQSAPDYLLERAAMLPSDIRIEALLYAQDNSFFVIPGPWFNSDSLDTLSYYINNNDQRPRPSSSTNGSSGYTIPEFPFYGQPVDMKITIAGAVVENLPANIGDQAAWMQKWGWIPYFQGSPSGTSRTTQHATGLEIDYDPLLGQPKLLIGGATFLRLDPYGRPLPYAPDLPVSPDLLYSGQPPDASLVQ